MARYPSGVRKNSGKRSSQKRVRRAKRDGEYIAYRGLCATCAKREACPVPKREGGVWHCEEYTE